VGGRKGSAAQAEYDGQPGDGDGRSACGN